MAASKGSSRTIAGLSRWSSIDKQLPEVDKIKAIHVYDFDNTLFRSPLPNKQVWDVPTVNRLQALEWLTGGGWWHDSNILASTGQGIEKEETRGWKGWWNENIAELVGLSMQQDDAITILLTGRKQSAFAELIQRMARSKQLDFDMVCLKPETGPDNQRLNTTMMFKQELLKDLVFTYREADELRIYEDRPRHTQGFRDFFATLNRSLQTNNASEPRQPFTAEVIQVTEESVTLDPVTEVAEVQRMINNHNTTILSGKADRNFVPLAIKRNVFFTGYLISPSDSEKLKQFIPIPSNSRDDDIRFLGNSILISARPCPSHILTKVGGIGAHVPFRITGVGHYDNKIWAARVAPVDPNQQIHCENAVPSIVLGLRRNARPIDANRITNWTPVPAEKSFTIDTIVGEKVILRVENELETQSGNGQSDHGRRGGFKQNETRNGNGKRDRDEEFPALPSARGANADFERNGNGYGAPRQQQQRNGSGGYGRGGGGGGGGAGNRDRGGRGGGRSGRGGRSGGRGGGGGGFRPRRGGGQYRSLDDAGGYGGGYSNGGEGMQY